MQQNLDFLIRSDFDIKRITGGRVGFKRGVSVDYAEGGREGYLFHYLTEGEREYICEGERLLVSAPAVIFLPEGTKYLSRSLVDCHGISTRFFLDGELERELPRRIYLVSTHPSSKIDGRMRELCALIENEPANIMKQKRAVIGVIERFSEMLSGSDAVYKAVEPAIEYISAHYRENDAVSTYAAVCNMSESYFRRQFKLAIGTSAVTYRNNLRLAEAKKLYGRGMTMRVIAERVGFCDENYLSRLYKKEMGENLKRDAELM